MKPRQKTFLSIRFFHLNAVRALEFKIQVIKQLEWSSQQWINKKSSITKISKAERILIEIIFQKLIKQNVKDLQKLVEA